MGNNVIQLEVDELLMKKMSFIGAVQKVFGVLAIIGGVICCIGIITAIVGIPYLLAGIRLFKSGSNFTYTAYSNENKFLRDAILNLASFWMMNIIAIIAVIVFYIVFIIIIFAVIGSQGYYY